MSFDEEGFLRELKGLTSLQIRAHIAHETWSQEKIKFAESYLDDQEAERQRKLQADALAIAEKGANAAVASAQAAKEANREAKWATAGVAAEGAQSATVYKRENRVDGIRIRRVDP
jgi:hypothetical protein